MHKVDLSNLSLNQLSELTGRTYRTVKEKLKGLEPTKKDGRSNFYDPRAALPLIYELEARKDPNAPNLILQDEKARLAAAQADKTELEVQKIRREVLPLDEVELTWTRMVMNFRAKILIMPARLAAQLAGLKKPGECKKLLKESLNEALEELSHYEPRDDEPDEEGGEESGAAGEPNGKRVGGPGKNPS